VSNSKYKYRHWLNVFGNIQNEIAPRSIQISVGTQDETYKAKFDLAKRIQLSNLLEGQFSGGTVTYESTTAQVIDDYDYFHSTQPHPISTNVPNGTLGYNWVFQNWSDGNTNQSRTIVLNNDINLIANYKGTQISNNKKAFSNNSQRKFVRSNYNRMLHVVYESMGKIWYETSTDNGVTWQLRNGGKPFKSWICKKSIYYLY